MPRRVGGARPVDGDADGYKVFTTAYDRELPAGSLVRTELLRDYRAKLDQRIAGFGVNVARLARELKALLSQPSATAGTAPARKG